MIVAYALWNLPEPLAMIGEGRDAALIIGFAERYWTEKFGPLSSADCEYIGLLRRTISASIGSRDADAAWESGRSLSYHDAVSLALACAPSA
jgi:hypothetical protein